MVCRLNGYGRARASARKRAQIIAMRRAAQRRWFEMNRGLKIRMRRRLSGRLAKESPMYRMRGEIGYRRRKEALGAFLSPQSPVL